MAIKVYTLTEAETIEYRRLVNSGQTMTYSIYATLPHILNRNDTFKFLDTWNFDMITIAYSDIESEIFPNS